MNAARGIDRATDKKKPITDKATDKLAHALTNIRMNPVYVRRQRRLEQFLRDLPYVGEHAEKGVEAFKAAVREFLQPPSFFEALGVRYVGPVDGHDIEALEQTFRNAVELSAEGPIVVHVLTQKGRGYSPAEDDDEKHLHGCVYGSAQVRRDFPRFISLIETGRLDVGSMVSQTIALDGVNDAFGAMQRGEVLRSVITSM